MYWPGSQPDLLSGREKGRREHTVRCGVFHLDLASPGHWALQDSSPDQPPTEFSTIRYSMLLQVCHQILNPEGFPKTSLTLNRPEVQVRPRITSYFNCFPNPIPSFGFLKDQSCNGLEGFKSGD